MMHMYAPDDPSGKKMTATQIELLRKIVATNGGGVFVISGPYRAAAKGLINRHMIQGKIGGAGLAVHTKMGLEWVRNNPQVKGPNNDAD